VGDLDEAGRRVDVARGADGNEQIAARQALVDLLHVEGHFTEPDDVGANPARGHAPGALGSQRQFLAAGIDLVAALAAHLVQLAVHVQWLPAAGALVQVVDVLGHQQEFPGMFVLEFRQRQVGGIGLDAGAAQFAPPVIVELQHLLRIAGIGLEGGHFLDVVTRPQAARAPEGLDAGFCRDAGAGQHHDGGVAAHRSKIVGLIVRPWYLSGAAAGPRFAPGGSKIS